MVTILVRAAQGPDG